jgi:multidrug efflux pump subunit AcrA (membrane-fusion protein)
MGFSPAAAACFAEAEARGAEEGRAVLGEDLSARHRARMLLCALPGCESAAATEGARALLRKCGACMRVAYCSPAHQRLDWKRHKPDCQAVAAQQEQQEGQQQAAAAAGAPAEVVLLEDEASLAALSVRELRARIAARGLDASGCIEKDDLVRLLLRAAPR